MKANFQRTRQTWLSRVLGASPERFLNPQIFPFLILLISSHTPTSFLVSVSQIRVVAPFLSLLVRPHSPSRSTAIAFSLPSNIFLNVQSLCPHSQSSYLYHSPMHIPLPAHHLLPIFPVPPSSLFHLLVLLTPPTRRGVARWS